MKSFSLRKIIYVGTNISSIWGRRAIGEERRGGLRQDRENQKQTIGSLKLIKRIYKIMLKHIFF